MALFAPQIRAIQPAFVYNDTNKIAMVYFNLSDYTSSDEVNKIKYTIIDPNQNSAWGSNSIIKNTNKEISFGFDFNNTLQGQEYFFTIDFSSNVFETLNQNQFYQLQLYVGKDSTWSEPSQISLLRPIAQPQVSIQDSDGRTIDVEVGDSQETVVSGRCYIEDTPCSDWVQLGVGTIEIPLYAGACQEGSSYNFKVEYITYYGYMGDVEKTITIAELSENSGVTISLSGSSSTGSIKIELKGGTAADSLERMNEELGYWEEITTGEINSYNDFTIQSEQSYKYRARWKSGNKAVTTTAGLAVPYEDILLSDDTALFAVRYNPNISGYKVVSQESITNTLGGNYPIIRSNGDTKYHQFNISGLIYEEGLVDESTPDDPWSHITAQEPTLYLRGNQTLVTMSQTSAIVRKRARDKIIEFLTNRQPKLFRSFEEGAMIIRLTNVSFTPNKTLGRRVYDFSATATELCDCTVENIKKYNLNVSDYIPAQVHSNSLKQIDYYEQLEEYNGAVTIVRKNIESNESN